MVRPLPTTLVIGAGRAGLALAAALQAAGAVVRVASRSDAGLARTRARGLEPGTTAEPVALWVFAVPDDAIAGLADDLARDPRSVLPQWSLHLAGSVGAEVLAPLAARGVGTAAVHPLQTFTARSPVDAMRDVPAAISGEAADAAREFAREFAHALEMRPFDLMDEGRAAYHAAAAIAANYTVTLIDLAVTEAIRAGVPADLARAGLVALARSAAERSGAEGQEEALTGPIRRGDAGTVRRHLDAIAGDPPLAALYRALGVRTVALAERAGLDAAAAERLRRTLEHDAARPAAHPVAHAVAEPIESHRP